MAPVGLRIPRLRFASNCLCFTFLYVATAYIELKLFASVRYHQPFKQSKKSNSELI